MSFDVTLVSFKQKLQEFLSCLLLQWCLLVIDSNFAIVFFIASCLLLGTREYGGFPITAYFKLVTSAKTMMSLI